MNGSKSIGTPKSPSCKLDKFEKDKNVDTKLYRGMIGSLLYLTASRPDIMFSICMYARYQSNSKEFHLITVKRIFRYFSETINVGLWYDNLSLLELIGYYDTDFVGYKLDRKSISGTCQFHYYRKRLRQWSTTTTVAKKIIVIAYGSGSTTAVTVAVVVDLWHRLLQRLILLL